MKRKGIILAGGHGTRLYPITLGVSKHLLPVFNKPMIYYPIATLMLAGIQDILLIAMPNDLPQYQRLLKDGSQWGVNIRYEEQNEPKGLAESFLIGEKFIANDAVALILGDNLFYGSGLSGLLKKSSARTDRATVFAYHVNNPHRYGVVEFDNNKKVISIEEKPQNPKSHYAITGLYFYDNAVVDIAKTISPSKRGELEISCVNQAYHDAGKLNVEMIGRGYNWLDMGTHESLLEASQLIAAIEHRQGVVVAGLEEIALRNNWIDSEQFEVSLQSLLHTNYGRCMKKLIEEDEVII